MCYYVPVVSKRGSHFFKTPPRDETPLTRQIPVIVQFLCVIQYKVLYSRLNTLIEGDDTF